MFVTLLTETQNIAPCSLDNGKLGLRKVSLLPLIDAHTMRHTEQPSRSYLRVAS